MAGRYPKPDGQKVFRGKAAFDWVDLPSENEITAPSLPRWREWNVETITWWRQLWKKPQASMWEPTGSTLWTLACLYDELISGETSPTRVSAEMRMHEDRHGLNPKSMLQLRWRITQQPMEIEEGATVSDSSARRERLRVVE